MKTLKVLLQEVVSGIKAWVNSNFAQESNTVHKTGNETVNGSKTFTGNPIIQNNPATVIIKNTGLTQGNIPESRKNTGLVNIDSNGNEVGRVLTVVGNDGGMITWVGANNLYKNGVQDPTGTSVWSNILCHIDPTGYASVRTDTDLIPNYTERFNLGTSTYQWKSVCAKSYYYNGTAWGLDKANVWTANQTVSINLPTITLQDTIGVRNTTPTNTRNLTFSFLDKNGDSYGFINRQHKTTGSHLHQVSISDGTYDYRLQFYLFEGGLSSFMPSNDGVIELGTSLYRWKTLNGVNPGALSLPDYDSNAKLNLTSTFPAPDSNNVIYFTPTMSGWLYVYFIVTNATTSADYFYAEIKDSNMTNANAAQVFWRSKPAQDLPIFFPVIANKQFRIEINFTGYTLKKVLIIPCMGHIA